jgi:hypothetical protein
VVYRRFPTSFGSREESDGSFEARCTILVSYMLPQGQASKCSNFAISNWLFIILLSPLPRSPGYSESYSGSYPENNSGDYHGSYSGSYSESYPDSYSEDYREGYPPRYSESYPGSYRENYPEDCSRNCPENCSGSNPESNPGSNWESNSEDYLPDCWEDYPGNVGSCPVSREVSVKPLHSPPEPPPESGASREPALSRSA